MFLETTKKKINGGIKFDMIQNVHRPLLIFVLYPSSSYVSIISLLLSRIADLLEIGRTNIYAFIKSQLSQVFFLMPHSAQNAKVLFSNHSLTCCCSEIDQ